MRLTAGCALVAESGGGLVGYIQGAVRLRKWVAVIPEEEPYVEIENVYVQPSFRHRRIGGQLMERLMAVAAHHGIQRFVVSSTSKEMDKMLHFSRRHGFTPWYVQRFKEMKRPVSYTRSAREHTVAAIAYSRHWALASRCSELPALL